MIQFWKKSLRVQIAGSFSLLSLTIVTLLGGLAFSQARLALKQSVFDRLLTAASLKEADLNRWLLDRRATLHSLNQLPNVRSAAEIVLTQGRETPEHQLAREQLQRSLGAFVRDRPDYQEIFVISKGGRVLMSTTTDNVGLYTTLNEYSSVSPTSEDNALTSNFYQSELTKQPTVTFIMPVLARQGQPIGMLAAHLNLDQIDEIIRENQGLGETGETYLVTDIGGNFFHKNVFVSAEEFGSEEFPDGIESRGILSAMSGNSGRGLYLNYRNIPVIGVYRWLGEQDVALLVEIEQSEALDPARQLARSILLLGLLLAGVMTLGILMLSHRIVVPILTIAETARSIRAKVKGESFLTLETVPILSENEIGTLADTFNKMTRQLQTSYAELQDKNKHLETALVDLKQTQMQLIHNEKMAGLGQMVAGIAHEVNNPVGFISGNIEYVEDYATSLLKLIQLYEAEYPKDSTAISTEKEDIELSFIKTDLPKLLASMKMGTKRIQEIVKSMRSFSRLDEAQRKKADLHEGIDNALLILRNRLKAKPNRPEIKVMKDYGPLPDILCFSSQLNQVFLNLIGNAIDALEPGAIAGDIPDPMICITTQLEPEKAMVCIADNGAGMSGETRQKIFDPFFTTKPVGKGTGLGLSISYSIVVEHHGGTLECMSVPDEGTTFIICIPH